MVMVITWPSSHHRIELVVRELQLVDAVDDRLRRAVGGDGIGSGGTGIGTVVDPFTASLCEEHGTGRPLHLGGVNDVGASGDVADPQIFPDAAARGAGVVPDNEPFPAVDGGTGELADLKPPLLEVPAAHGGILLDPQIRSEFSLCPPFSAERLDCPDLLAL